MKRMAAGLLLIAPIAISSWGQVPVVGNLKTVAGGALPANTMLQFEARTPDGAKSSIAGCPQGMLRTASGVVSDTVYNFKVSSSGQIAAQDGSAPTIAKTSDFICGSSTNSVFYRVSVYVGTNKKTFGDILVTDAINNPVNLNNLALIGTYTSLPVVAGPPGAGNIASLKGDASGIEVAGKAHITGNNQVDGTVTAGRTLQVGANCPPGSPAGTICSAAAPAVPSTTSSPYRFVDAGVGQNLRNWNHTGSSGDCFYVQNTSGRALSHFLFEDIAATKCGSTSTGTAMLHIKTYDPKHDQSGNVYDISIMNPRMSVGAGDGIRIDGHVGVPALNVFGGEIGGVNGSSLHFTRDSDSIGVSSVIHSTNILGTVLQGTTGPSVWVDSSYLHGTMIGAYFEQVSGVPPFRVNGAGALKAFFFAGNQFGTAPSNKPAYMWEANAGSGTAHYYAGFANVFNACGIAAYKVEGTSGAFLGFGDSLGADCLQHFDWTNGQYRDLFAWDLRNHTFTASSDSTYFDHPRWGIAIKGNAVQAMLHVGAQHQPDSATSNGSAATDGLRVDGGTGGNTSGNSGQKAGKGANILLTTGNGGGAPGGSTNGDGGDVVITLGKGGAGAGTAGSSGKMIIKSAKTGATVTTFDAAGNPTFNGAGCGPGTYVKSDGTGCGSPAAPISYTVEGDTTGAIDWTDVPVTVNNDDWVFSLRATTTTVGTGQATLYVECDDGITIRYASVVISLATQSGFGSYMGSNSTTAGPLKCRLTPRYKIDWTGANGAAAHYRVKAKKD